MPANSSIVQVSSDTALPNRSPTNSESPAIVPPCRGPIVPLQVLPQSSPSHDAGSLHVRHFVTILIASRSRWASDRDGPERQVAGHSTETEGRNGKSAVSRPRPLYTSAGFLHLCVTDRTTAKLYIGGGAEARKRTKALGGLGPLVGSRETVLHSRPGPSTTHVAGGPMSYLSPQRESDWEGNGGGSEIVVLPPRQNRESQLADCRLSRQGGQRAKAGC